MLIFLAAILFVNLASADITITELKVPKHVIKGDKAELRCIYDMQGEDLYSLKWFKDSEEFFKYIPSDEPKVKTFNVTGVIVDDHASGDADVVLVNTSSSTSGRYRCEVSAEAPSFLTVSLVTNITVVYLPEGDPVINGLSTRYNTGDVIQANCSSSSSIPAADLVWEINSSPISDSNAVHYDIIQEADESMTSVSGIEFEIKDSDWQKGSPPLLKVKCSAIIANVYWKSIEQTVWRRDEEARALWERRSSDEPGNGNQLRASAASLILAPLMIWILIPR